MNLLSKRDATNEDHWLEFASHWLIRPDTTYLNHGSFGPPPQFVKQGKRHWVDAMDAQPMDFYTRHLEPALEKTRSDLARFIGTVQENVVLVENATYGMNIIADSFELSADDEILSNNHEYGAVHRIWQRKCERSGAKLKICQLPDRFESDEQIVKTLTAQITDRTKAVIISHITSATAIVMPLADIARAFKAHGIAVIVDGPHAPVQVDVDMADLNVDFYTASCHKWLCAGLGSGFLYVAPKWQDQMEPQVKSWGRLLPAIPEQWFEEFIWSGTRDPSAYLSISNAIEFITEHIGLESFRQRSRYLASTAEQMFVDEFGIQTIANRQQGQYASMAQVPLPANQDFSSLQQELWDEYKIEVPIIQFDNRWFVRVSCHLYNNLKQIETLMLAIRKFLVG